MRLFPLLIATIEQVVAYARYFVEKRDPAAAFLCVVFLIFGPGLAIVIDLAFLPARIYEAVLRRRRHRQPRQPARRAKAPDAHRVRPGH